MPTVTTERLRVPLTAPQAVTHTSAVLWTPEPDPGGAVVVLGHGAGTDLTHPMLRGVARGLAERNHPVVTFNFAYTEAGRKRPDPAVRLESAYRDVLSAVRQRLPGRPLVIGGRSMGGRMASRMVAESEQVDALVLLSYPLTPAGHPERLRTDHWPKIDCDVLFVSGDRDRLCDLSTLERERTRLGGHSTVHVVAGADHSYGVRARDGRTQADILEEVVEVVAVWLDARSVSSDAA